MTQYEYKLLSYVHDTLRQERVNIGVLFYSADLKFLEFGFRDDLKSLKGIFLDFRPENLKSHLANLRAIVDEFSAQCSDGLPFHQDIEKFSQKLVPGNAGSLEWGRKGSGISDDLEKDFQRVFEKLVQQRHSKKQKAYRPDAAVLGIFKKELKKRNMLDWFKPEPIELSGFNQELEYTFQNGVLHCLKPVSFDVGTEDGILDKALKIKGWHEAVTQNSPTRYTFYYLVGKPSDAKLLPSFENAYRLLPQGGHAVRLTEDDASELPSIIERAIHQSH